MGNLACGSQNKIIEELKTKFSCGTKDLKTCLEEYKKKSEASATVKSGATGTMLSKQRVRRGRRRGGRRRSRQNVDGMTKLDKLQKVLIESTLPKDLVMGVQSRFDEIKKICTSELCDTLASELALLSPFMLGRNCSTETTKYRCGEIRELEAKWSALSQECMRIDPNCEAPLKSLSDYYDNEFSSYGCKDSTNKIIVHEVCQAAPKPEEPKEPAAPEDPAAPADPAAPMDDADPPATEEAAQYVRTPRRGRRRRRRAYW